MRKNNKYFKQWKIKLDIEKFERNVIRKKKRIIRRKEKLNLKKENQNLNLTRDLREETFEVPENFSIINNPNETIEFFNNIYKKIDGKFEKTKLFLDMSSVNEITVDALIYLIALIKNIRQMSSTILAVRGNMPKNEKCRLLVSESGFLDHVQETNIPTIYNNNKIRIRSGGKFESHIIKEVIDFIHEDSSVVSNINTRYLYRVIGEIMNNSIHHAYDEDVEYEQKWLIFVEKTSSKYKFTLLDTGLGIPNTVDKKIILESSFLTKDFKLLESALEGKRLRTQTKQSYRGKGLPEIRRQVFNGVINNMSIISCKASCKIYEKQKEIIGNDLNSSLRGTLYYWEIIKNEEVQNVNN